jgi:hypothetical protein
MVFACAQKSPHRQHGCSREQHPKPRQRHHDKALLYPVHRIAPAEREYHGPVQRPLSTSFTFSPFAPVDYVHNHQTATDRLCRGRIAAKSSLMPSQSQASDCLSPPVPEMIQCGGTQRMHRLPGLSCLQPGYRHPVMAVGPRECRDLHQLGSGEAKQPL